ncbi:class I SAM-dependent methyltransferase [Stutzerimonas urumqiensis]|uniref:class I SAM-dependent methyltransferase n=1 Tax=Stutzerimonas urumqiensis TaxID=638269 RepID=UPI001FE88B3B|nr:class I SAM-dependent methyltransferase [Stutzerimonas urumqiensis]
MSESSHLFGSVADGYASFRPVYPDALFDWLVARVGRCRVALDIGAGSGQASRGLDRRFEQVIACDASEQQLRANQGWATVMPVVCDAERLPVADSSVDLIIVAQALHWFATDAFFAETRRVLHPSGFFCAWCYGLIEVTPAINEVIRELHGVQLAGFWPVGRESVDRSYADIQPPFPRQPTPALMLETAWQLTDLLGYLRTWSAVTRWQNRHGGDLIQVIEPKLRRAWRSETKQRVRWPLHFIAGYPNRI